MSLGCEARQEMLCNENDFEDKKLPRELKKTETSIETSAVELAVMGNDLSKMSSEQRLAYYREICDSVGLNWVTRPFQYIQLNGKLTLYATKGATDQIRQNRRISVEAIDQKIMNDLYITTVTMSDSDGRKDSDVGAVSIKGLSGDSLANAIMKSITKAKRRATLSMCGLGVLDDSELETTPAKRVDVNMDTGDIIDVQKKESKKNETDNMAPYVFQGGPYAGKNVSSVTDEDYLSSLLDNPKVSGSVKDQIFKRINDLNKMELDSKYSVPEPVAGDVFGCEICGIQITADVNDESMRVFGKSFCVQHQQNNVNAPI